MSPGPTAPTGSTYARRPDFQATLVGDEETTLELRFRKLNLLPLRRPRFAVADLALVIATPAINGTG